MSDESAEHRLVEVLPLLREGDERQSGLIQREDGPSVRLCLRQDGHGYILLPDLVGLCPVPQGGVSLFMTLPLWVFLLEINFLSVVSVFIIIPYEEIFTDSFLFALFCSGEVNFFQMRYFTK